MDFRIRLNWLRVSFAIGLVAAVCGFAWIALHSSEPEYQGRTLTSWLEQSGSNFYLMLPSPKQIILLRDSKTAIQQIGTNALPYLLQMASVHDSSLKSNFIVLRQRLPPVGPDIANEYHNHFLAYIGFDALGIHGKDAAPLLITLLKSQDSDIRSTAARSLGKIGPASKPAIPHLLKLMEDTDTSVREDAITSLGQIHLEPEVVVPVLIKNLKRSTSRATIYALRDFGGDAKPAVPDLVQCLNDENEYVRFAATNALKQIDPEAAAKAGIK
jgi:HEAT repeat protein